MTLRNPVPSFVTVEGYVIKTWYRGQERTCRICGRTGHVSKNCPKVRCFSCWRYGHVASECDDDLQCDYCYEVGHTSAQCQERDEEKEKDQEGVPNETDDQNEDERTQGADQDVRSDENLGKENERETNEDQTDTDWDGEENPDGMDVGDKDSSYDDCETKLQQLCEEFQVMDWTTVNRKKKKDLAERGNETKKKKKWCSLRYQW